MLLYGLALLVLALTIIRILTTKDPGPLYGVYSQTGKFYTLKYYLFLAVLSLRKWQNARKSNVSGEGAGYGMRSRSTPEDMDKPQTLDKKHPKAVDAVYFNAGNADGCFMVFATARRHKGLVQTIILIRIPGVGVLQLPGIPDTSLYTDKENSYTAGGLELKVVEAMKTWKITYQGKLKLVSAADGATSLVDVRFDLDWRAVSPYFDFDTDLNVKAMAASIAREPWSREFFDTLKTAHQTHYEQFGEITGDIHYGGKTYSVKVQGVRDHSYGNIREWSDLHRYAIQYAYLEDGTCVCVGNICMRPTMTRLIIGYIFRPDGSLETVSWTDLDLHKTGEDGRDPDDISFSFTTGSDSYKISAHVEQCCIFYMGLNWEARIHERFCSYNIGGKKGWGISEWDYHNKAGKDCTFKR